MWRVFVNTVMKESALFCDITQRRAIIVTDVSGQRMGPIFKGQEVLYRSFGTDRLSRNVGTELPPKAA
jgi:hypothetical protein